MQASNARPGSLDGPQKASPVMSRAVRKLKITGSESDPASPPNSVTKTPRNRSPNVVGRQSPRSPAIEKKKMSRVSELESQIAQLEEELKKTKDQLSSPMSLRQRAQQETEDAKKQLAAMLVKLEETQNQLKELSNSEEAARVQELRKISQDRDRAWKSELEALQKQHFMDSSALASAMNEIHKLKIQLDRASEPEVSYAGHAECASVEIQRLRCELRETFELVEKLKTQLSNTRESEARAVEDVSRAQMQLKVFKNSEESLLSENAIAMESYKNLILELEESKNRVISLEEVVRGLQSDLGHSNKISAYFLDDVKTDVPNNELLDLKHEVDRLRSALETAERRCQDEYIRSTLEINNANELLENVKSESFKKELEIELKIKASQVEADTLRAKLIENDDDLKSVSRENKGLSLKIEETTSAERELETELEKSESLFKDLQACLLEKENQLQIIREDNKILKSEILKKEKERNEATNEAIALTKASRAAEQEAIIKIGYLTEESQNNRRKTARVTEQLDATQVTNLEMETELRRLKVQSDQWRKAAEMAAAMLSTEKNGKYVGRTGSLDYCTGSGKFGSPYSEDIDDSFGKKKNGNMLKKIVGVLLKKGAKGQQ